MLDLRRRFSKPYVTSRGKVNNEAGQWILGNFREFFTDHVSLRSLGDSLILGVHAVRAWHQSQDRHGARADNPAFAARAGGSGHRVGESALHPGPEVTPSCCHPRRTRGYDATLKAIPSSVGIALRDARCRSDRRPRVAPSWAGARPAGAPSIVRLDIPDERASRAAEAGTACH